MAKRVTRRKKRGRAPEERFEMVRKSTAGIDVGSREIWVSVPPQRSEEPVRMFGVMTDDLRELATWLRECRVDTVALESTGVYWVPLYEILEEQDLDVWLVNAREVKSVPGRKSDVLDCQWIRRLHTYGLLRKSFRPAAEIVQIRQYLRQRDVLVRGAADEVRRMHQALTYMNIRLQNVVSDITGQTGMAILRSIVAGERDVAALAEHRDYRCRASSKTIEQSLTGNYRDEHILALKQAIELWDLHQKLIAECDAMAASALDAVSSQAGLSARSIVKKPRRKRRPKDATVDYCNRLLPLIGVDLTAIPGISDYSAAVIVSEIGTDISQWRTAGNFASWLRLVPRTDITGGKPKNRRTLPTQNRVTSILRMAALNAGRSNTALGAFYRNFARRKGKAEAVVATAHKIARIIYAMLRDRTEFHDIGFDGWEGQRRERNIRNLKRRAQALGVRIVEESTPEAPQMSC